MKKIMLTLLYVAIIISFPLQAFSQATAVIKGTVTEENGDALPGANVLVMGQSIGASTDKNGRYEIKNIQPGPLQLRVTFVGYKSVTKKVTIEANQTLTQDFSLQSNVAQQQEITVVGSRFSHEAAGKLAVPVDTFSPEQIESQGTAETTQILEQVAPSVNFPHQTVADGTDAVRPFTLRGLSPDQTLVLINGKRRHPTALVHRLGSGVQNGSSGVDLNAIPSIAIGNLQVLRDGAAAQYGSDAIAGVINLELKSGAIRPEITARLGEYTPDNYDPDGETYNIAGQYDFKLNDRGFFDIFAQYQHREPTNRAGADPRDQFVPGDGDIVDANGNVVTKNNAVPQPNFHWGDGKADNVYAWWNGEYTLNEDTNARLYTFGGYSHRASLSQGFYRRPGAPRNWPQIYPNGFLPNFDTPVNDFSATLGIKGNLSGWNYDLGSVLGRNHFTFNITNSLNATYGPNIPPNQTSFYAGAEELTQSTTTLDVNRQFDVGLSAPLKMAFGAAFRYVHYGIEAGEPKSYNRGSFDTHAAGLDTGRVAGGSQVFPGFLPPNAVSKSRTNESLYADLQTDPFKNFQVDLAGRFESYSDFGQTVIGKVSFRYQPDDIITLRAAAGTGFRAPNLSQNYFSKTSTTFQTGANGQLQPFRVGIFRTNSEPAQALGAKSLDDEKSKNLSAGFAISPTNRFIITADYYFVRIDDRIILSGTLSGDKVTQILSNTNAVRARYFTNAINTRTQGVDVTLDYQAPLSGGATLGFNGSFDYNTTDIIGAVDNPPVLDSPEFREQIFGLDARTRLTKEHPETKSKLSVRFSDGNFDASITSIRYGKVTEGDDNLDQIQTFSAKTLFNAQAGYQIVKQVKLDIGARNIFDVFPDRTIAANNFNGIFPYTRASPFGINGRFIYSKLTLSF